MSLVDDFSHLERLEDGRQKAAKARAAVGALRKLAHGHDSLVDEQKKKEERRRVAHEQLLRKTAVRNSLDALNKEYMPLLTDPDHQRRGYRLEKILRSLFEICDLDPRASFKIVGEQLDGAFSFETTDYLFGGQVAARTGRGCSARRSGRQVVAKAGQHARSISFCKRLLSRRCGGTFIGPTHHDPHGRKRSHGCPRRSH